MFVFTGNAGGYLGLFLGYALLNVPDLILAAYDWIKQRLYTMYERRQMNRNLNSAG